MIAGTTPTLTFSCPFLSTALNKVNVVIRQEPDVYIVKRKNECTISDKSDLSGCFISIKLSEMETSSFIGGKDFESQLFVKLNNSGGDVHASQIIIRTVDKSLKFGVVQ